jgi:prephenate dehydratase
MPVSLHNQPQDHTDTPRVAFQGILGAFSELAIHQHWPRGATPIPNQYFEDALHCVLTGSAQFAVIPIENAIAGVVYDAVTALDFLRDDLHQHAELEILVQLCLMALPGVTIADLRTVRTHPMALGQCRIFCAQHPWFQAEPHDDTAGAAREVASLGDRTLGAIASEAAARHYGLEILAHSIQDVPANWTRFVVVSKR